MDKIIIEGGNTCLQGEVAIEGVKNAVLPLLAATILPEEGKTILTNVPVLSDVFTMNNVVHGLDVQVDFDEANNKIGVDASGDVLDIAPYEYVSKIRASIVVLGPILVRNGHAKVSMPGGCMIGSHPTDLHLKGLEAMGAKITQSGGDVTAAVDGKLKGTTIYMDFPSIGATQNLMMTATLADGVMTIKNVARESEIVDLAMLLNKMGVNARGADTETLTITGVDSPHGAEHDVVQDRIEAGTFMVAAAMTSGNALIKDAIWEHDRPLISKLIEMGVTVVDEEDGIRVIADASALRPVTVKTLPHPGLPTDMQVQFTALMVVVDGESTMTETVFENRFQHLEEMRRMGLQSETLRDMAMTHGDKELQGAPVMSTDLRTSAALILTGMVAKGTTTVGKLIHLDRGYYKFYEKLAELGANIERVSEA